MPPVVIGLQGLDAILKSLAAHLPAGATKTSTGAVLGTLGGAGVGAGVGALGGPVGAIGGGLLGGAAGAVGGFTLDALDATKGLGWGLGLLPGTLKPAAPADPEKHSMNFIAPPQQDKKPIVLTAKLDINSRTLAQTLSQALADLYENSPNAASMNGVALLNYNGANPVV